MYHFSFSSVNSFLIFISKSSFSFSNWARASALATSLIFFYCALNLLNYYLFLNYIFYFSNIFETTSLDCSNFYVNSPIWSCKKLRNYGESIYSLLIFCPLFTLFANPELASSSFDCNCLFLSSKLCIYLWNFLVFYCNFYLSP